MTGGSEAPGRLRWKCRRGMRELDVLLSEFLRTRYAALDPSLQHAFSELLELQDPEIWAYLLDRAEPEAGLVEIVRQIRDFSPR